MEIKQLFNLYINDIFDMVYDGSSKEEIVELFEKDIISNHIKISPEEHDDIIKNLENFISEHAETFHIHEDIVKRLKQLQYKNIDPIIKKNIHNICENYSNEQIKYMMCSPTGLNLDKHIKLYYYGEQIGFKCMNVNYQQVGSLPVCVTIERVLNNSNNINII